VAKRMVRFEITARRGSGLQRSRSVGACLRTAPLLRAARVVRPRRAPAACRVPCVACCKARGGASNAARSIALP